MNAQNDSNGPHSNDDKALNTTVAATNSQMVCEPVNNPEMDLQFKPCALPADVEHIDDVEWASEDPNNPSPFEYATRPRYAPMEDPCGCTPAYDEESDTIDTALCCTDSTCVLFACQEECRGNCEAGDLCGNKRITKKQWKKVQVIDAGVKGRGLVLMEDAKCGDFIIEYTGIAIKKDYLDSMFRRYRTERMLYIMALDNDVYIDARKKGSVARYINHSCDPNCAVHRWKVRGINRAGIFALRDIKAGEELSFDYKWKRKRGRAPTKCHCGSSICRGTLEDMLDKSEEEEREEIQLRGHWKVHAKSSGAGHEIMNRTIKVYSEEENEYFLADVCKYDPVMKKHCLIYRGDLDESWENLDEKQWLILDEEMEQFVISKRTKDREADNNTLIAVGLNMNLNSGNGPIPRMLSPTKTKNYLIIQTPIKEMLFAKHLVDRCQRHYRVQISVIQVLSPNSTDSEEGVEESNALKESKDGKIWKLIINGLSPLEACQYLEKNINDFIEMKKNNTANKNGLDAEKKAGATSIARHEIVIPRCVVDHAKARMNIFRNSCNNAEIIFVASASISKKFAKLVIQSPDQDAALKAQNYLWKELLTLCNTYKAPRTPKGLIKDLAFFGGELSKEDFDLLCPRLSQTNISHDCAENLRESAGMAAFEDFYRCTIWVQASEDMGRINSSNQIVSDTKSGMRKIFFGTEPKRIPELWGHIKRRISEIKSGVRFLSLESDKDFLVHLRRPLQNRPRAMPREFFAYLEYIGRVSVQLDRFSKDFIRIDGVQPNSSISQKPIFLDGTVDEEALHSAKMVEEIIKLQIELFRDNNIRSHRWGFGRDWSLLIKEDPSVEIGFLQENETSRASSRPNKRYVVSSCMEIATVVEKLRLDASVGCHACIILYRYLNILAEEATSMSQAKMRDVSIACLFLANKSQKECKWKRLEDIISVVYKVLYSSSTFQPDGDEATSQEKRILSAEYDIITCLDYDIFWRGVDWITTVACEAGMSEECAKNVMELTLSGPVLASGPIVWLKFGPAYAFTAMAALLQISIENILNPLSLNPLKLCDTVDLIVNSLSNNKGQDGKLHNDIFKAHSNTFSTVKTNVKEICKNHLGKAGHTSPVDASSQATKYFEFARRYCQKVYFPDITTDILVEHILPKFGAIRNRCMCDIYVEEGAEFNTEKLILSGSWRSLALGENMVVDICKEYNRLVSPVRDDQLDGDLYKRSSGTIHARSHPGLLKVSSIQSVEGWEGISDNEWTSKIGGKTCMPGKVYVPSLLHAGLRWWIPPSYCPSLNGSLCNILGIRRSYTQNEDAHREELAKLAMSFDVMSSEHQFPILTSFFKQKVHRQDSDQFVPVSIQCWPPKKTLSKERERGGMGVGVSPAALQEMQLLTKLHSMIPGPQGHPNILLPIAIAVDDEAAEESSKEKIEVKQKDLISGSTDDLLADFMKKADIPAFSRKSHRLDGSYLVFQPTPIILQRVINKFKNRKSDKVMNTHVTPLLLTTWFHDLLSAIDHCHRNHIVLRTIHPDQIFIDNNGVIKLSGLARSIVIHPTERDQYLDPLASCKSKKNGGRVTEDDIASNPYMAPELLLGATRYTQQTDLWTLAALIAHLMIGKPAFSGRDRKSKSRAIFKIVGIPGDNNYKQATLFPHYQKCKPEKKYKSDVAKALRFMLRETGKDQIHVQDCEPIISLLENILILDPRKRLSAADALEHSSMTNYEENTTMDSFRQTFVKDWTNLKEYLRSNDENVPTEGSKYGNENGYNPSGAKIIEGASASLSSSLGLTKRPASVLDSELDHDDNDDLYDITELAGNNGEGENTKRAKVDNQS
jgi:histone-lysine N-methyltransferase SETD2